MNDLHGYCLPFWPLFCLTDLSRQSARCSQMQPDTVQVNSKSIAYRFASAYRIDTRYLLAVVPRKKSQTGVLRSVTPPSRKIGKKTEVPFCDRITNLLQGRVLDI
jgi:hypothetical protein